jgi:hypothetical protein
MTPEERAATAAAYHEARLERIKAEKLAKEWICEEQRLAHKLNDRHAR